MAKPLVKTNINLSELGFKIVQGKNENKDKKYIFAEVTDEIVIDKDNIPRVKLVGWELPNKKGSASLKIDYEEGKKYNGSAQYPPTIGWCNVQVEGAQNQSATASTTEAPAPIQTDDLPF